MTTPIDIEKKDEPAVPEVRNAIRALKAYKDAIYWFPKEEEAKGGVHEMMSGLEYILQAAINASRKLPSGKLTCSEEETTTDTSEYQFFSVSPS